MLAGRGYLSVIQLLFRKFDEGLEMVGGGVPNDGIFGSEIGVSEDVTKA